MSAKHWTNLISRAFGRFARREHAPWCQHKINRTYVRLMKLDMSEFDAPESYASLNALFTRALKSPRPIDTEDNESIISPCDAKVSQAGFIRSNTLFQIKAMPYSLEGLLPQLGRDALGHFEGGAYANLYLSPKDYHRYHAPATLALKRLVHIPGKLWPVNLPFLRKKRNLFIENERVVLECEDTAGRLVMLVFVGALNVGKMRFVHLAGFESNVKADEMSIYELDQVVKKGDLLGWFEMGSTILILGSQGAMGLQLEAGQSVRYGQKIGCALL